jgi:hypothetical protein
MGVACTNFRHSFCSIINQILSLFLGFVERESQKPSATKIDSISLPEYWCNADYSIAISGRYYRAEKRLKTNVGCWCVAKYVSKRWLQK